MQKEIKSWRDIYGFGNCFSSFCGFRDSPDRDRVWIGGSVTILGGVTIGSDTIIGAGSVVTHDIPSGVIAVGNPCRVLREIGEHDKEYYYKDRKINYDKL